MARSKDATLTGAWRCSLSTAIFLASPVSTFYLHAETGGQGWGYYIEHAEDLTLLHASIDAIDNFRLKMTPLVWVFKCCWYFSRVFSASRDGRDFARPEHDRIVRRVLQSALCAALESAPPLPTNSSLAIRRQSRAE